MCSGEKTDETHVSKTYMCSDSNGKPMTAVESWNATILLPDQKTNQ